MENPDLEKLSSEMKLLTDFFSFFLFAEIQAAEAMKWLRDAGFPQYAQMYQGMQ